MNAAGCVFNVNTSYFSQNLFYTLLILFIVLIFIYVKSAKYSFSLYLDVRLKAQCKAKMFIFPYKPKK